MSQVVSGTVHDKPVVTRPPAVAVDVDVVTDVAQGVGLSEVIRITKIHLQPADLALVSHTHPTVAVVLGHAHFPGTAGAMTIRLVPAVLGGGGVSVVVGKVVAGRRIL